MPLPAADLPPPTLPPVSADQPIPASQIVPPKAAIQPPKGPAKMPEKSAAKKSLSEALGKIAKGAPMPDTEPPKAAGADDSKAGDKVPGEGAEPPEGGKAPAAAIPVAEDGKKGKANPWKLVDEYKARVAKTEGELAEANKRAIPKERWDEMQGKLTATEKRAQELESEIVFTNYSKSKEYKEKYETPYNSAWGRATNELKELTVDDGNGNVRPFSAQDIVELLNLPLPKARELAVQKFGEFADDVMAHRKEIRQLFEQKQNALDEAQKTGLDREKQRREQFQQQHAALTKTVMETWEKSNKSAMEDPNVGRFLKPVEGDTEWNDKLTAATKLADEAFNANALDPRLTPEQRQEVIEKHAAVRNRSIAYSMLRHENTRLSAQIASLEKQLKEFKASEPDRGGSVPQPANGQPKGFDRIRQGLAKIAK